MPESLARLVEATRRQRGVTPFVGSGLALAATGNAQNAGWAGLILDGIDLCQRTLPDLRPEWADGLKAHLIQADITSYLTAAQEVTARLRGRDDGRAYTNWLADGVGSLRASHPVVPRLVCGLSQLVLTTNYDTLIEQVSDYRTVTWTDENAMNAVRERDRLVLHLHGVAHEPDSVVLGWTDYQQATDSPFQAFAKTVLAVTETLLFVGCGAGLNDPSVGPALRFVDDVMPRGSVEHFLLVPGPGLRAALAQQLPRSVTPVAFGAHNDDLPAFLEHLVAGTVPAASQDPATYDRRPVARPVLALLDLAAPAEEGLKDSLETARRALRAAGQLERRTAAPAGLPGWDLADQYAVLEQQAASAVAPARWLADSSARLVVKLQESADTASRLLAPEFSDRLDRLRPMLDVIDELDAACQDIARRVAGMSDRLVGRSRDQYGYRAIAEDLRAAKGHADEAAETTGALAAGFRRAPYAPGAGPSAGT